MNPYQQPMAPYPGWGHWTRQLALPRAGLDLFCYDTGASSATSPSLPAYVLIHGLGDEADTWRGQLPLLAQQQRVIALDLPGFGRSAKPRRTYTVPFLCAAVLELMDLASVAQAVLVGHSLGGVIAHCLTLSHPERVQRLVLISGSLLVKTQKFNLQTLLMLAPGLGEWLYTRLRRDPQAAYRTLEPYHANLANLSVEERAFLLERVNQRVWDDAQRAAFFSTLRHLARWTAGQQRGLSDRLAQMRTPTTIVWGSADQIMPVDNGRWLAKLQPGAVLHEIPAAGHNVQQDAPQEVLTAIQCA